MEDVTKSQAVDRIASDAESKSPLVLSVSIVMFTRQIPSKSLLPRQNHLRMRLMNPTNPTNPTRLMRLMRLTSFMVLIDLMNLMNPTP
jgi:hypothetical protein